MKSFNTYINEKLKITKNMLNKQTITPQTVEELVEAIKNEIKLYGGDCSLEHINISNIKNISYLFSEHPVSTWGIKGFCGDISKWNMSNVDDAIYMFNDNKSITSIKLPDTLTKIHRCMFFDCENLTNIEIPDSVTDIGAYAFRGCKSLSKIELPDTITNIGDLAFMHCESLTSIIIPEGVTCLKSYLFAYCNELTDVTLPKSINKIKINIFNYCSKLKNIKFNGTCEEFGKIIVDEKWRGEKTTFKSVTLLRNEYNKSIELLKNNADSIYTNMRSIERKILQENRKYLSVSNYSVSWKDIQNNLSANEVAIEFVNYPYCELDIDSIVYGALVVRKEWTEPTFIALKKESIIQYHYHNRTDSVKNISIISPRANFLSRPITGNNGDELYQCIWGNLVINNLINPGDNIYFSASGILHQIPIESLPIGNGKIMSDVYNMHRLSSTRELVKEKKEMKYTKAVLYGGLNYDMTDDELLSASQTYTKDASTEYFVSRGLLEDSIRGYKWDNLSNTQQEVDYISDLMKKNQITTQTYKGNIGNEESFKALSGHEYNIIHLATHGFFYPDEEAKEKDYFKPMLLNDHYQKFNEVDMSMWRSGLVLSGGNRAWKGDSIPDTVEDGILKAQEIGDLDLRGADLVVLSACNTGQGEVTGEGVFGLQRAFKMAGAQTIIMSLTPVDDQTTMAMMNKFYTNLFSGQSKHDAFYNAQRYIRSIKPDPKYWMGWIMLD